jgi:hypothetical protein
LLRGEAAAAIVGDEIERRLFAHDELSREHLRRFRVALPAHVEGNHAAR